jgi:hypothetical protein
MDARLVADMVRIGGINPPRVAAQDRYVGYRAFCTDGNGAVFSVRAELAAASGGAQSWMFAYHELTRAGWVGWNDDAFADFAASDAAGVVRRVADMVAGGLHGGRVDHVDYRYWSAGGRHRTAVLRSRRRERRRVVQILRRFGRETRRLAERRALVCAKRALTASLPDLVVALIFRLVLV